MVNSILKLLLAGFWISVSVIPGVICYILPILRSFASVKTPSARSRFYVASTVSDAPNNHDDVTVNRDELDRDSLIVLPPELPQKSIVWSVSPGVTELSTAPNELQPFPYVPTLDASGLLPRSAYYRYSTNDAVDSKPTCRLQIAWDISPPSSNSITDITSEDRSDMVSAMQDAVDHGFTTLQMKSYTRSEMNQLQDEIYQSFIKDTPKSVVSELCQIVVPLRIQDVVAMTPGGATISSLSVRTSVTTLLDRLQTDCLDNVQVSFQPPVSMPSNQLPHLDDDRFYLDLLYELQELQRTGYIRSISTKGMPSDFYVNAVQSAGFQTLISSNAMDANLFRVQPLLRQHQQFRKRNTKKSSAPLHVPFSVAANPLAGGWLTDRFIRLESQNFFGSSEPSSSTRPDWFSKLSAQEKANWNTNIWQGDWTRQHGRPPNGEVGNVSPSFRSTWDLYRTHIIKPLQDIAHKHGVSTASIALRWLLQAEQKGGKLHDEKTSFLVASTVVSSRLLPEHFCWDRPYTDSSKRIQQLREVVTFELDEEDMECLWNISGGDNHESELGDIDQIGLSAEDEPLEASSTGLFLPKRK